MTQPRTRQARSSSILDSPWLAAILALVVILLGGIVILPGLLGGGPGATPTPRPTASPSPSPTPLPTFARPTPSPAPTFTSYTVQAGDTLSSIARQFGTTARSIAWWNRGTYPTLDPESEDYNPNNIKLGWVFHLIPNTVVDENNPPTPSPGPATPAPTTGAGATPTPPAGGPATVLSHGRRDIPTIALTFDMGGRLDPAVDIVQWLIDHEVHATIFPTGFSATQKPEGIAAMQLAATRPDLFDFGNHSWDHPDFRELSKSAMAQQLTQTEAALTAIVGSTKPWFRPPFGGWNAAVQAGVGAAGWGTLAMWDVDTIDWRPVDNGDGPAGPTTAEIVAKVRNNARGGSIVLMHLGGWNTLDALPGILEACSDLGLQPVTLTELVGDS